MKSRLLVIDDDSAIRDTMRMLLEYDGYEVLLAASGQEGLAMVEKEAPDLVFLDVKMPGMDGLEVLSRLRGTNDSLPVVIVSAHGNTTTALEAGRLGAFRFIEKPLSKDYVLDAVREGLELGTLRRENRQLRSALETRHHVVGESGGLRSVMDQVRRAAPTNATVLILGESGAGKELIARAVHRNSLRARERFVEVNCAAIPEELIEAELFGHEKGAFTGAVAQRLGRFELAHGGSLFLDEIGELPVDMQVKLLRVLQESTFERVGGMRTINVDVRLIAATNRDLHKAIVDGVFREDLFYRLNVVPIVLPPLRERTEDIPVLVSHFTAQFSQEHNRRPASFSREAIEALKQARWRGNIRELKNVVERLLIMSERDVISARDVTDVVGQAGPAPASAAAGAAATVPAAATLRAFKEATERAWLVDRLREHAWNISKTAEVIDTLRSNLYKKLEQYGIRQEVDG